MNSDERANIPTQQSPWTSLRTSAAPKPGPTPATIATRLCFLSVILAMLCETKRRAILQVRLQVSAHVWALGRRAIAMGVVDEKVTRRVFQAEVRVPHDMRPHRW